MIWNKATESQRPPSCVGDPLEPEQPQETDQQYQVCIHKHGSAITAFLPSFVTSAIRNRSDGEKGHLTKNVSMTANTYSDRQCL